LVGLVAMGGLATLLLDRPTNSVLPGGLTPVNAQPTTDTLWYTNSTGYPPATIEGDATGTEGLAVYGNASGTGGTGVYGYASGSGGIAIEGDSESGTGGSFTGSPAIVTDGNVGINQNSPGYALDVESAASTGRLAAMLMPNLANDYVVEIGIGKAYSSHQSLGLGYYYNPPNSFAYLGNIGDGISDHGQGLIVAQGGNVGIGTNAPLNPLDVVGAAAVGTYAGVNTAPSNGLIVSGSVGIGTATPEAPLTVVSPTSITAALIGSTQGNLIFAKSGTNGFSMYSNAANYLGFYSNDSGLQPLTMNGSGIAVGNAYKNTAPPTNGAIIQGDVGIGTSSPAHLIQLSGGAYSDGTNWTNASDRNLKENFTPIDEAEILNRLDQMPIQKWNYRGDVKAIEHVGPVAQDFYGAFRVGEDDKSISTVDAAGVAFAAIKALHKQLNEKNNKLETENNTLRERIEVLERKLAAS